MSSSVPQSARVHICLDPAQVVAAHARHRRRFAAEVAGLDDTALATQSRCDKWTVADVLRHLCDVDAWMAALWTQKPLPFTGFDPNTTPHEYVLKTREVPDAQIRENFVASCERLARDVENSGPARWALASYSPIGAVPWWLSALHIFYDSWVHERDALMPLGVQPPVDEAEAVPVLAYSLALAGIFGREELDTVACGVRLVAGRQPVIVEPAGPLDEDAGALIDAVNGRADIDAVLLGTDPEVRRRLGALARFFGAAA